MRGPNAPDPCEDCYFEFYAGASELVRMCAIDRAELCPYDGNRAMCDEQQGDHIEAYREEL